MVWGCCRLRISRSLGLSRTTLDILDRSGHHAPVGKVIFLGKELCRLYLRDDAMMALQPQLVRSLSAQPILPEICSNLIKLPAFGA